MQPLVTERRWFIALLGAMVLAIVAARSWPPSRAGKVRLTVRSCPAGALVETVDGKLGRTPLVFDVEPNVTFDITVGLAGYSSTVRTLKLMRDSSLFVSLDPSDSPACF
jgi:hypothetical protein